MSPETFKKKVQSAVAPYDAKLSKDGDYYEVVVSLPNGCMVAGKIAISDDFDFVDLVAQCQQAEAAGQSDTLFMIKCKNIKRIYSLDKTYKHLIVPDGVECIEGSSFFNSKLLETISLPSTITDIGEKAFAGCESLKRVEIPAGIKTLQEQVFYKCKSLVEVIFNEGLTSIQTDCFTDCASLETIDLPDSVVSLGGDPDDDRGNSPFEGCSSLKSVKLPKGIQWLGVHPFGCCPALSTFTFETDRFVMHDHMLIDKETHTLLTIFETTSAVIPEGIISIGACAADKLTTLKSITLPSTLVKIGAMAFSGDSYPSISNQIKTLTIPDGVTEIGEFAFRYCTNLVSISFPQSLKDIKRFTLSGCSKLSDVKLPASLTVIPTYAFNGCSSLTELIVPDGVTEIQDNAFSESGIQRISLPDGLTKIGRNAFYRSQIEEIEIPASVTTIATGAFALCKALHTVTFTSPSVDIEIEAFDRCESLTTVNLPKGLSWSKLKSRFHGSPWGTNPPAKVAEKRAKEAKIGQMREMSLEAMAHGSFAPHDTEVIRDSDKKLGDLLTIKASLTNGCYVCGIYKIDPKKGFEQIDWEKVKAVKEQAEQCQREGTAYLIGNMFNFKMSKLFDPTKVKHMVFADGVKTLVEYCLSHFAEMQSVVIPDSVIEIESYAFEGCRKLTDITLPAGIQKISFCIFNGCQSLERLVIPDGVTEIQYSAFSGCISIEEVIVPESVTEIGEKAFNGCVKLRKLTLPSNHEYTVYPDIVNGCDPQSLTIVSERFELLDGFFIDNQCHFVDNFYWSKFRNPIGRKTAMHYLADAERVVVPDGIEVLASDCFRKEDGAALRIIELPSSLEYIGNSAFRDCQHLEAVHVPDSVKEIHDYAFRDCSSLVKVELPATLAEIGQCAFSDCVSLKELVLPTDLTKISFYCFDNCTSLESIVIPDGVEEIDSYAFKACTSLKSIKVPVSVSKVGHDAFKDCTSLESLEILGASVVRENAFADCTALKHVTLGSADIKIDATSFSGCTAITEVDLPAGLTWGKVKTRFKDSPWSLTRPTKK